MCDVFFEIFFEKPSRDKYWLSIAAHLIAANFFSENPLAVRLIFPSLLLLIAFYARTIPAIIFEVYKTYC